MIGLSPNERRLRPRALATLAAHPPLEGHPIALDWEAHETFETRTSWVDDAVIQATKRLAAAK